MTLSMLLIGAAWLTWPQFRGEAEHTGVQLMGGRIYAASLYQKWSLYIGGDTNWDACIIADVDQDGAAEIILPVSNNNTVRCYDGATGALEWSVPVSSGYSHTTAAAADLVLANGALEVVVRANNGGLFCLNGGTGATIWSFAQASGGWGKSPTIAECVPANATTEVLSQNGSGTLYCVRGDNGALIWSYAGSGDGVSAPTVADVVPGNGTQEVIYAAGNTLICVRGDNGVFIWSNTAPNRLCTGAVGELVPANGTLEVAVTGETGVGLRVLRADNGALIWSYPSDRVYSSSPAIADINNDGQNDVVVTGCSGGSLWAVRGDNGALLWQFNPGDFCCAGSSPAVADIDCDSVPELLYGTDSGLFYAIDGITGLADWTWQWYTSGVTLDAAPAVGDLDGDGNAEIAMSGGYSDSLWVLDGDGVACDPVGVGLGELGGGGGDVLRPLGLGGAVTVQVREAAALAFYATDGRLVERLSLEPGEHIIKRPLLQGVYLLKLTVGGGESLSSRLVVY